MPAPLCVTPCFQCDALQCLNDSQVFWGSSDKIIWDATTTTTTVAARKFAKNKETFFLSFHFFFWCATENAKYNEKQRKKKMTGKRRHQNKHNNQTNWPGPEEVANYLHNMHYNGQLSVRGVFPKSSTFAKSRKENQEVDVFTSLKSFLDDFGFSLLLRYVIFQ